MDTKDSIRDQIADLIGEAMTVQCPEMGCIRAETRALEARDNAADQILALFRSEISKLKLLSDIRDVLGILNKYGFCTSCGQGLSIENTRKLVDGIAQTQLDSDKKELFEKLEGE